MPRPLIIIFGNQKGLISPFLFPQLLGERLRINLGMDTMNNRVMVTS